MSDQQQEEWMALTEQVADWRMDGFDVRIDERIVSRIRLCGGASRNGHRYTESALRDAAVLYDRKPVFLDHAQNLTKPYDRSMRDLAGWITAARFAEGEIVGEIRVLDTEAGRTLLALMKAEAPAVGMSHVILARKSTDGTVVEQIHDVISIDAVVFPATTRGFREGFAGAEDCELASDLDAVAELRRVLEQMTSERDQLRERCNELGAEMRRRDVERELSAANLPGELITASLRDRLQATADSAARSRLIAEHQQFVSRCRQRVPCSHPRASPCEDQSSVLQQIVQAIKSRH